MLAILSEVVPKLKSRQTCCLLVVKNKPLMEGFARYVKALLYKYFLVLSDSGRHVVQ